MIAPLVGRRLDGAAIAAVHETGGIGAPVWGPLAMLRDLETRLGLAAPESIELLRVEAWRSRLGTLLPHEPFYARSYAIDPLGTAEMLLTMRDELVEAGWDGKAIANGGPRLATFALLEQHEQPPVAPGHAERLAAVEREIAARRSLLYARLTLVDDRRAWSHRWRRVFDLLAAAGTEIAAADLELTGASEDTDLGRLQALLRADRTSPFPVPLRGDGSLVLLRAATSLEAGDVVGAWLRAHADRTAVVVRGGEALILDEALRAHGFASQGVTRADRNRPPLQLLPLALELVFDPPDPYRALELLALPVSPFSPVTRHLMSRAVADAPGIGGPRWRAAKSRVREILAASGEPVDRNRATEQVALVEEWFESPRHDPRVGAPVASLAAIASRVAEWLRRRLAVDAEPSIAAAYEQSRLMREMLARDSRPRIDLLGVRRLLDAVLGTGAQASVLREESGRPDHVDHPGGVLAARDLVVWWHFVADTARPPHRSRWRRSELDALAAIDVHPPDPGAVLAEDTRDCRRAALAARNQLVLVMPDVVRNESLAPHPFWDEIVARLRADDAQIARITVTAASLLDGARPEIRTERPLPLALPEPRPAWRVSAGVIPAATAYTPESLETLLGCPLRWVLGQSRAFGGVAVPEVPEGALLNGLLGHRLLEALVEHGALADPADAVADAVPRILARLLPETGAPLLHPGMSFERFQLEHQLAHAMRRFAGVLQHAGLRVAAVEEELDVEWRGRRLRGRLDVRLFGEPARAAIVDLKWGHGRYRDRLALGLAVQLASYAHAWSVHAAASGAVAAGYFSLSRGRILATDAEAFELDHAVEGPPIAETFERMDRTVPLVEELLASGDIPVTGVRRSLPLLESVGVPETIRDAHFEAPAGAACDYCGYAAICGKAWEDLS